MAKRKPSTSASESRLFVLALGLLVGFVIAFVLVLSRMPVDGIISQYNSGTVKEAEVAAMNFDYYAVLEEQRAARRNVAVEPPVIFMEPPRDVLPKSSQLNQSLPQSLPAEAPVVEQARPQVQEPRQPVVELAPVPVPAPKIEQPVELPRIERVPDQPTVQPRAQPQVRELLASETGQDTYFIETGNFPNNDRALQEQSSLRRIGLDAFIVVRQDNSGIFGHRVRIGPFLEQSRLDATRNTLRSSGIRPKLIRVKR